MARGKWKFTPTEIKRAIEAVQRSKLQVTAVRVSGDSIFIETDLRKLQPASPTTNEWDDAA